MPGYRTGTLRTVLTTHYPVGGPETTEEDATLTLLPVDDADLDVMAEPIAHGTRVRRFAVERVELRYRRVVRFDQQDLDAYQYHAELVPWTSQGISAHGTSVRADGTKGVAAGVYWWSQPPHGHELPIPDAIARMVAVAHAWYGVAPA